MNIIIIKFYSQNCMMFAFLTQIIEMENKITK